MCRGRNCRTFLSSTPPLGKSRAIDSLGAASALSCSPTERSTEEETPIARADCEWVFVRVCAFIADYGYCVASCVRGATTFDYTVAEAERAANN